jgi:hypothetical protein
VHRPYLDRHDMEVENAFRDRPRPFRSGTVDHVVGGELLGRAQRAARTIASYRDFIVATTVSGSAAQMSALKISTSMSSA